MRRFSVKDKWRWPSWTFKQMPYEKLDHENRKLWRSESEFYLWYINAAHRGKVKDVARLPALILKLLTLDD